MANSSPLKYTDVAEPKLLDPLKKELEDVNKLLGITESNLKGVFSDLTKIAKTTPADSFANLEKKEKAIREATQATKELDKIEKDRVRLQKQLADLDDERTKANFELKEQIRLQTKELRDNAKAAASSGNAYEKLKRETNEAQAEFKKLAAEFGSNSKQAQDARKTFERLDKELREINESARDGRRDVGRYEKGVKSLTKAFKLFASATIILKVLELIKTSVSQNTEGAADFEKIWVRITATFQVVSSRLVAAFNVIKNNFDSFVVGAQLQLAKLTGIFSNNGDEVQKLQKRYDELAKSNQSLGSVFAGIGEEIQDLIDKNVLAIDKTIEYRKAIVANEEALASQIESQRKLQAAFDDDSTSIQEQIKNGVAYRESLKQTQALELEIARSRQQIAQVNAAANPFSLDAREELAAANMELAGLLADQAELVASTEREIQKLRNDSTELNLDFYIDDAQNRIDTNQRIIDDETQTFKRRRELLLENDKEREIANNLRAEALNKTLKEMGKAELDFEKIRKMTSSEAIAEEIQNAGLSEQLSIRALEIIRERRTEIQDSADAQRDLNQAEAESLLLQSEIAIQQEALNKLQEKGVDLEMVLADLSEARLQNEIDNLRSRVEIAKEGSAEFIALNKELNDKLLEQNQERLTKEKEQQRKFLERTKEQSELVFDTLGAISEEFSRRRVEAIDRELEAERDRINTLETLAAEGNEDAQNNLALTEKRQAELELKREQQLQRQQRAELALTALQTYSGKVQAGEKNPLASTIADISVLRAFISALPNFYEGTEDTGTVSQPLDSKGGRLAVIHDNERIIDKANNRLIGQMSNSELAHIANRERIRSSSSDRFSPIIVKELRELKSITKDKPTYLGTDYDQIANAVVAKIQKGNKLERIHRKNGGIWG